MVKKFIDIYTPPWRTCLLDMKEVQNMLKDQLLKDCRDALIDSNAGHCDCSCNNKEYCYHDCKQCLDQVHWHSSSEGRSDYGCPWLPLTYILHFTERYSQQITDALDLVDSDRYPYYNIFSMGCGAAPDLMAFEELVQNSDKTIYYKGYDRNPLWEPIHDYIENYTNGTPNITAKPRREDIFDVFADGKPAHQRYNIVVLEYLLSHFYNDGQNTHIHQLLQPRPSLPSTQSRPHGFICTVTGQQRQIGSALPQQPNAAVLIAGLLVCLQIPDHSLLRQVRIAQFLCISHRALRAVLEGIEAF